MMRLTLALLLLIAVSVTLTLASHHKERDAARMLRETREEESFAQYMKNKAPVKIPGLIPGITLDDNGKVIEEDEEALSQAIEQPANQQPEYVPDDVMYSDM